MSNQLNKSQVKPKSYRQHKDILKVLDMPEPSSLLRRVTAKQLNTYWVNSRFLNLVNLLNVSMNVGIRWYMCDNKFHIVFLDLF